jgi:hypothetical protein
LDPNNNIVGALGPNDPPGQFNFNENRNEVMDKDEFCKKYPSLTPLINYLFDKEEKAFVCVTYDDVLGNKLYTLAKGRGEKPVYGDILETGYLKDLNNK